MKSALIIGLGRYGRHTAMKLNEIGIETMAVDKNEERVREVMDYVTSACIGDSTNEDFIKSIGVSNFDLCVVAIGDDFLASLETTALLSEHGAKKVISRTARDTQEKFLLRNGADAVVYPERLMGEWTAVRYSSDHVFDYIRISKDIAVFEIGVPIDWVGKTIATVDVRRHYQINIIGVRHGEKVIPVPGPDYMFSLHENLLVIGTMKQVQKAFHTTD